MSTQDKLDKLNALDELFPFFRCPWCKDRKTDKLSLNYKIIGYVPVRVDNPTKMFHGKFSDEELGERTDVSLHCDNCGHNFPVPEGWNWRVT